MLCVHQIILWCILSSQFLENTCFLLSQNENNFTIKTLSYGIYENVGIKWFCYDILDKDSCLYSAMVYCVYKYKSLIIVPECEAYFCSYGYQLVTSFERLASSFNSFLRDFSRNQPQLFLQLYHWNWHKRPRIQRNCQRRSEGLSWGDYKRKLMSEVLTKPNTLAFDKSIKLNLTIYT